MTWSSFWRRRKTGSLQRDRCHETTERLLDKYNQLLLREKCTSTESLRGATSNRSLQDGELEEQALRYNHMIVCRQQSVKKQKEDIFKIHA